MHERSHSDRWAVRRGVAEAWRRGRESWGALPDGGGRRYAATLAVGIGLAATVTFGLTRAAQRWAEGGLQGWDERVLRQIEGGRMSFPDAILAESPGNLSYLIPLTLAAAVLAARGGRALLAVSIVASYVLARGLVVLGWWLWDRPRPKLIAEGLAAPGLHSYPSGHVVLALAVWGLLAYAWCEASRSWVERVIVWVLLLGWVGMIGWARLRLGTHWPSDVIAGGVIGVVWLGVVIAALRRGERGMSDG